MSDATNPTGRLALNVSVARGIRPESWVNRPEWAWYKAGYSYAAQCTLAIPALSDVTPENLYYAVTCIIHGAQREGHDVPEVWSRDETCRRLRSENKRLRDAARWFAANALGTPVPDWVDRTVNSREPE